MWTSPSDASSDIQIDSHPWCLNLTPFGELFIWSAPAAQWLRCKYRILGRASLSIDQTANVSRIASIPTRLPIRLSVEEATLLLSEGILNGLRRTLPISETAAPSEQQLEDFRESVKRNAEEMKELFAVKRRLNATAFYSQLVNGLTIRKKRQSCGSVQTENQPSEDDSSSVCSTKQRRRALRQSKKRFKKHQPEEHSDLEEVEVDRPLESVSTDTETTGQQFGEGQLTVDNLLRHYSIGRPEPQFHDFGACHLEDQWRSCIPRHLPRATPQQWERAGEVSLIPLPDDVKSQGLCAVFYWLTNLMRSSRGKNEDSVSCLDAQKLLRCRVFADIWSKGVYMTTSSVKMGGDFLIYPGDPLLYHASHVVLVTAPDYRLSPRQLAARMRLANSVRKSLVLATSRIVQDRAVNTDLSPDSVVYTTIQWTNWVG